MIPVSEILRFSKQRLGGGKLRPAAGVFETEGHRWRRGRPADPRRPQIDLIPLPGKRAQSSPKYWPTENAARNATPTTRDAARPRASDRRPYRLIFRVFSRVRRTTVANRPGADPGRWTWSVRRPGPVRASPRTGATGRIEARPTRDRARRPGRSRCAQAGRPPGGPAASSSSFSPTRSFLTLALFGGSSCRRIAADSR